jgi:hypothetical protein
MAADIVADCILQIRGEVRILSIVIKVVSGKTPVAVIPSGLKEGLYPPDYELRE